MDAEENPAVLLPCAKLARDRGVEIRQVRLTDNPLVLLERLASLLTARGFLARPAAVSYRADQPGTFRHW